MKVMSSDLEAVHRFKKGNTIVKFVNRRIAEYRHENRKSLEEFNAKEGTDYNFFDHLSPFMAKLAFYCRALKRKDHITGTSSYKGIVRILFNDGWQFIKHLSDILLFFSKSIGFDCC